MTLSSLVLIACALAASVRWLRVAQYEHYLAGSCTRFALRWFRSSAANVVLGVAFVASAVGGVFSWRLLLPAAILVTIWPLGLGLRGRTSKLRWTRRLRTLAIVAAVLGAIVVAVVGLAFRIDVAACVFALVVPLVVDAAWLGRQRVVAARL